MESTDAIAVFAALSQPTRLRVFRLLMQHEPDGVPAGVIAAQIDVPQNTLSTHLSVLNRAGLISAERSGRSISYRAELQRVREITTFLVRDCCDGRPELCEPVIADLTPCCGPRATA